LINRRWKYRIAAVIHFTRPELRSSLCKIISINSIARVLKVLKQQTRWLSAIITIVKGVYAVFSPLTIGVSLAKRTSTHENAGSPRTVQRLGEEASPSFS
jgi:hypothetical protein